MPTGLWLPVFEMHGGVDLIRCLSTFSRCPSTFSVVEGFGALPAAPAIKRDGVYGVASTAIPVLCLYRLSRAGLRHLRHRQRSRSQPKDRLARCNPRRRGWI